ncbi:TPA: ead/Ea22-like family protein [Escherichia coli]
MSKIDYQGLREAAEKAGEDKWQAKKINGDFFVIRHGSYTRQHGYTSYQPIAEIDCKPVRDFVAKANPATVLALLDERERNQQYIKSRDHENEDIALTVGKLRVELEGKDKLITELGKQCAECERKALSNFEERAAMAERIEEMSKQSCESRERDLFESWVMHSICISKSTLEGLRTETGYRNATLSGTDFNRMWKQWKSIRATGIRIKGE